MIGQCEHCFMLPALFSSGGAKLLKVQQLAQERWLVTVCLVYNFSVPIGFVLRQPKARVAVQQEQTCAKCI